MRLYRIDYSAIDCYERPRKELKDYKIGYKIKYGLYKILHCYLLKCDYLFEMYFKIVLFHLVKYNLPLQVFYIC